jgi:transposase
MMPNDLPPWHTVHQQTQRWLKAGVFETMVQDLRALPRLAQGCQEQPTAAIFDSRTLQPSPESGQGAGYDGHKRKRGSRAKRSLAYHLAAIAAGTWWPCTRRRPMKDRAQVEELARQVREVTEQSVEVAFVDQGYTGDQPAEAAQRQGMQLEVIKLPEAKKGFVLLPRRWVVERSFA